MRRAVLVAVCAGLAWTAAAAKPRTPVEPATEEGADLPVPPIPPGAPSAPLAPVPDLAVPTYEKPFVERGVEVSPGLFTPKTQPLSDSFLGQGDAQSENEKRFRPTPGIKLTVPIR